MEKKYKKFIRKMDSILNFNFAMIYIIQKILALIKNHLNYLRDNIFEFFFKKYNRLLFISKNDFFHKFS